MKISSLSSGMAVAALALFSTVQAFAKETPQQIAGRKAIVERYAKADQAFKRKDVKTLSLYLAPDFKIYSTKGKVLNRDQYIATQNTNFAQTTSQNLRLSTKIRKIQWRGADAIVWVDESMRFVQQGYPIERKSVSRDYWAKTSKGWFIRQAVQLEDRAFVGGREINIQ